MPVSLPRESSTQCKRTQREEGLSLRVRDIPLKNRNEGVVKVAVLRDGAKSYCRRPSFAVAAHKRTTVGVGGPGQSPTTGGNRPDRLLPLDRRRRWPQGEKGQWISGANASRDQLTSPGGARDDTRGREFAANPLPRRRGRVKVNQPRCTPTRTSDLNNDAENVMIRTELNDRAFISRPDATAAAHVVLMARGDRTPRAYRHH